MLREIWFMLLDMMQIALLILCAGAVLILVGIFVGRAEAQQWTCQTIGNVVYCSGFQNGRYVTCTTTYIGGQSYTNCN